MNEYVCFVCENAGSMLLSITGNVSVKPLVLRCLVSTIFGERIIRHSFPCQLFLRYTTSL